MSFFPEDIIKSELRHDEELLWHGMPNPSEMAKSGLPITIFGVIFTSVALFMFSQSLMFLNFGGIQRLKIALKYGFKFFNFSIGDLIFPLVTLFFVIIGVLVMLAPLWISKKAKRTFYGISNKRCLIIHAKKYKNVHSYDIDKVKILNKLEKLDGSGTLIFAKELSESYDSDTHRRRTTYRDIGFYGIPNVRDVENILNSIISGEFSPIDTSPTTELSKDSRNDSVSY
ncbi:hypothetical protein [Oceanirhabdus sp. W0125-5]|uniref:hypothetical protein n=1 Tax=Oceanirhabdus sp. W0125-5 TaxID=2999116 RepID=UPI0022F317A3|nr:hypothetical protein [Oceanirhabdus sp. W0125-5]WBW99137.1 hypothetical protein OW730_10430 [Oceanirhabdus sp. W0125-5]